jgi:predicted membrane-bound spermidine synthase
MDIKHWFISDTVYRTKSKYHGEIQVVKFFNEYHFRSGGLVQSGRAIRHVWNMGISEFIPDGFTPKSILILGLGAGSSADLLSRKYHQADLTGIEIDPEVIKIGELFFKTDQIPGLEIIQADAVKYVKALPEDKHFDICLVDCFQGDNIPEAFENPQFLIELKRHCQYLLLNRLVWGQYKATTLAFITNIDKYFHTKVRRTLSNVILSLAEL